MWPRLHKNVPLGTAKFDSRNAESQGINKPEKKSDLGR